MKTTINKTDNSLSDSRPSKPFFHKSGEGTFLSKAKETERTPFIQPKLTVGESNDKYEQEADAVADKVMSMDSAANNSSTNEVPAIQREGAPGGEEEAVQMKPDIQKEGAPGGEEEAVQMKPDLQKQEETEEVALKAKPEIMRATEGNSVGSSDLSSKLGQNKGSGSKLPDATNSFMSNAIGSDFSNVNVHTGDSAVQMNEALGARAFAHGSDVYFNKGEYNPNSSEGKRLLAHELTHVVQQNGKENSSHIQRTGDKGNKLLEDFAKDFKGAADLIKKSPEAMLLVKEALKDGVKYGGHSETGPGKMAWPYTMPTTKTVYVPKARTDQVIAMSDFIFELNNALHAKRFKKIDDEAKKGSKGSLTAKQFAYKNLEIELDGMLRTGEIGLELQKSLKEGKVWYKKYDADFFMSTYESFKNGKITKAQLVKMMLNSPSGASPGKTQEQYYMDQYKSMSGGK